MSKWVKVLTTITTTTDYMIEVEDLDSFKDAIGYIEDDNVDSDVEVEMISYVESNIEEAQSLADVLIRL